MNDNESLPPHVLAPESKPINIVEKWPQAAAIVSGFTVMSAIAYNWAYFQVAAPSAMQFLNISDQVSSALQWLPASILMYSFSIVFNLIVFHENRTQSQNTIYFSRKILKVSIITWAEGLYFFTVVAVYFFSSTPDWSGFVSVLGLGWFIYLLVSAQRRSWIAQDEFILTIGSALLMISLVTGNQDGLKDFTSTAGNATLITKEGTRIEPAVMLREIDKGVLLRIPANDKIMFVPWEDVSELTVSMNQLDRRSRICVDFNIFCSVKEKNVQANKQSF